MDKKNAEIGNKHERFFSNSIKREPQVIEKLKNRFGIFGDLVMSYPTGRAGGKADVILKFSDRDISANVKSFGKMGFNQATRGTVESFVKKCGLNELENVLSEGVIRKANKGRFIAFEDETKVLTAFSPLARGVVEYALARLEKPELLVLYDNLMGVFYIFDLEKALGEMNYEVSFSKAGNICIGDQILFHRKGGDGNNRRFDKFSSRHPGNNLAVKLLCREFIEKNEPISIYKPTKR